MTDFIPPFCVVPMPVNAKGEGPEMDSAKVVKTEWEVWDALNRAVSSHETEADALAAKARLQP